MAQAITTVSAVGSRPYITVAEYKQAPTSVDVDDFVGGGSLALNDVELSNVITRASSWIDTHCGQVLAATQDTDSFRARVSRDGFLRLHTRFFPIIGVVSASYGSNPLQMNTIDVTTGFIEQMSVTFPLQSLTSSFMGTLQFSNVYSPLAEQFVTITYTNGYANAVLSANSVVGATSITVSDRTGFQPGTRFTVFDGINTEQLTVASSYTPATGAGTVALASAATLAHTSGVSVSALPAAVKQAAIYMTNVILKSRGNSALVMQGLTPSAIEGTNPNVSNDYAMACDLLKPFRRMR